MRAVARSALLAQPTRRRLIEAKVDDAPPPPAIAAKMGGDVLSVSSPTQALALPRSPRPPAHSCHSSRRRARLGSCLAVTTRVWRPSHAGFHSHCRTPQPPDDSGTRRSATSTSRADKRWPKFVSHERSVAQSGHVVFTAARARQQPRVTEHSTIAALCRGAHTADYCNAEAAQPPMAIGDARCCVAIPRAQPWLAGTRQESSPPAACACAAQTHLHR